MSQSVLSVSQNRAETTFTSTSAPAPSPCTPQFSEQEILAFQEADRGVAKLIVCIMSGIFTVGLLLYTIIAWLAARGGH